MTATYLTITCCVILAQLSQGREHILLLGDSIDRGIQHAWCSKHNTDAEAAQIDWGDATIQYGGHYGVKHCPAYCADPRTNNSFSAVHIYGSNADGPYFTSSHEISAPLVGNIRNTTYRIRSSIRQYIERFGLPTKIMLNTVQWDLQGVGMHTFDMANFKRNTLGRLEDIRLAVNDVDVLVGMRTAPAQVKTGKDQSIALQLNEWTRQICMSRVAHCEIFYDYDLDLWSIENLERSYDNHDLLFEDSAHPKPAYSAIAGERIMQTQYTKYFRSNKVVPQVLRSETTGALYYVEDRTTPPQKYNQPARALGVPDTSRTAIQTTPSTQRRQLRGRRLQESAAVNSADVSVQLSDAQYNALQNMRNTRRYVYTGLPPAQLHCLQLSTSSALDFADAEIAMLPVAGTFPAELFNFDDMQGGRLIHGVVTTQSAMYLVYPNHLLQRCISVERVEQFTTLQKLVPQVAIVHNVDNMWFEQMGLVTRPPAPPTPFIETYYKDNTLLRLHTEKQVYVVRNMTRFSIPSVSVFFKYGWDFDNVRVIMDSFILDLLPSGGDMT